MIFVRAPFRIPIGGGGTDLPSYYSKFGGSFISAAITRYMFVTVNKPILDTLIRVKYAQTEIVDDVKKIKHELAEEACRIEIDRLKRPVGKQDQYIAAFGGVTKFKVAKNGSVKVQRLPLAQPFVRDLENSLLIFYTGISREEEQILKSQS